jgi:dipeptidase E
MKIILAGGGGADDAHLLDELFATWIRPQGRLLYWPIALRGPRTFDSCLEWITATFAPLAITNITMWTELAGHQAAELEAFDGLYIGGGNTFSLLAELRASGFDAHLKAYAQGGKPVYGGSAGAVLLGRDIQIVSHMDHNDAGLTDTSGLDLVQGYAVLPHYEPKDDELIHTYIERTRFPYWQFQNARASWARIANYAAQALNSRSGLRGRIRKC